MQQLCPGASQGSGALAPLTLWYLIVLAPLGSPTGGSHFSAQAHTATGVTTCGSLLLLLTDQAQQGNTSLKSRGTRLSHTRRALCEGNQKQVMFESAVPTQLDQAIKTQLYQYRDTQKCPLAPECAGMCLQHGLSTAWHTEASLQIRDEG